MRRLWRGDPLLAAGGLIILVLTLVAVLAPFLAPHDPTAIAGDALEQPSGDHLLGTNDVGEDILSEVVWGTRASLRVALPAAALVVVVGLLVGAGAGLIGGRADVVAMRIADLFLALPALPLILLLVALAGPSTGAVVIVIAILGWPGVARIVRAQTRSLRQRGYVASAWGFGAGPAHIVGRHLVPALGPILVTAFVQWAAAAVLLEAGLAFLGLGDPTGVSWGLVLSRAVDHPGIYLGARWTWWALPPGLAITLASLGFVFVGIGLEPRLNPRWNRA